MDDKTPKKGSFSSGLFDFFLGVFKTGFLSYAQLIAPVSRTNPSRLGNVLDLTKDDHAQTPAAMIVCPRCGQRVNASEENCPNCLKMLRAA
jgi:hypothetical protein